MRIVQVVYTLTRDYPKEEMFALTSQTKRAAVSVPSNIAEGIGRHYKRDTIQFLHVSRGSLYELETHLEIALMMDYINENYKMVELMLSEEVRILNGLIRP